MSTFPNKKETGLRGKKLESKNIIPKVFWLSKQKTFESFRKTMVLNVAYMYIHILKLCIKILEDVLKLINESHKCALSLALKCST
jgi:hypothetical protein